MERRTALKNMALILGGAVLLPYGVKAGVTPAIELNNLHVTPAQEKLLADICETIIPKTNTPGAKDLRLQLFVIKMVDDCSSPNDQQAFMTGLDEFGTMATKKDSRPFGLWPTEQRISFLTAIEQKNDYSPALNRFYRITKDKTIQGYTQSQFFMTKEVVYELVPGRYNAVFPVKNLNQPLK